MKISEMVEQLNKIKFLNGDIEVFLHDSGDGNDYRTSTIYVDEECVEGGIYYPSECIIGFDHDIDIR